MENFSNTYKYVRFKAGNYSVPFSTPLVKRTRLIKTSCKSLAQQTKLNDKVEVSKTAEKGKERESLLKTKPETQSKRSVVEN